MIDDYKESILYMLDRRRSELGEDLKRMKYSCPDEVEQYYRDGYVDGYRDGYLELLDDLYELLKYDQLDY